MFEYKPISYACVYIPLNILYKNHIISLYWILLKRNYELNNAKKYLLEKNIEKIIKKLLLQKYLDDFELN